MEFSLQAFFEECLSVINSDGVPGEKWAKLKTVVEDGARYADECAEVHLPSIRK